MVLRWMPIGRNHAHGGIFGGLFLHAAFFIVGWRFGGGPASVVTAEKIFIPVWLVLALVNMWIGVSRAGYSVGEEFPIFLVIFAIPAIVAGLAWRKLS